MSNEEQDNFESIENEAEETENQDEEEESFEDDEPQEDDNDDVEKTIKSLKAQKDHYRKKYEKLLKDNGKPDARQKQPTDTDDEPDVTSRLSNIELNQKKWDFGVENGLEPRIVNDIYNAFGRVPTSAELKDPAIKGAIEGIKRKYRVKDNTPGGGSSKSNFVTEDFAKLSKEDKQARFEKYTQKFRK